MNYVGMEEKHRYITGPNSVDNCQETGVQMIENG